MTSCSRESWYLVFHVFRLLAFHFLSLLLERLPSSPSCLQLNTCTHAAGRAWSSSWERQLCSCRQLKGVQDYQCSTTTNLFYTKIIVSCLVVRCTLLQHLRQYCKCVIACDCHLHIDMIILPRQNFSLLQYRCVQYRQCATQQEIVNCLTTPRSVQGVCRHSTCHLAAHLLANHIHGLLGQLV